MTTLSPIGDINCSFRSRIAIWHIAWQDRGMSTPQEHWRDQYNWLDTDDYVVGLVELGPTLPPKKSYRRREIVLRCGEDCRSLW